MFKLDIPVDPREAAALELRRNKLEQRKKIIFDAKARKQAVDPKAIEAQIAEKRQRQQAEKQQETAADEEMVRQEQVALSLEQQHRAELKAIQRADTEFWSQHQAPQSRREWDLNDPMTTKREQPLRTSDGGKQPGLGASSLQVFEGEDDAYAKRVLTQRLQQRDWASQQLQERARIEAEEREFDRLQELQMQQAALRAFELQQQTEKEHAEMVRRTAEENRRKMEEAEQRKKQEQQAEQMRNYEELVYSIKSSVAAESPESAVGKGKCKILPDRFRGMTPEQIAVIRQEQVFQAKMAAALRQEEETKEEAHRRAEIALGRQALLLERQIQREQKEERMRVKEDNYRLAQEQKAKTAQLNDSLGRNQIAPSFFDQFNRDAR